MSALVLIVVLSTTVLVGTTLGGRYSVAPPVLLITMGALLALLPPLSEVVLEPEVVLLLFLPAILYRESLVISIREIRANLPAITLLAVVLVVVTMIVVSLTVQQFGVDPAAAWVLGAVLAPTDAAAVAGLAKRMPRRLLTTLRAESLINDGTALVLFSVTVGLIAGGAWPAAPVLLGQFAGSAAGGVAAGLLAGGVVIAIRRRLDDPLREGALSVLTPFLAFLLAELVHASGVLAVVVAGLVLSYFGPRVIRARSRVLAYAFWDLSTFLINGSLFVLLGMQIPRAARSITSTSTVQALTIGAVAAAVVMVTRMILVQISGYGLEVVARRRSRVRGPTGYRVRTAAGWAGFRGAVSLAAALAVPVTTKAGDPIAERDLIIFCTAMVIVLTMVIEGTTLPAVVNWAQLKGDVEREDEIRRARTAATRAGLAALPEVAAGLGMEADTVDRLRADYQRHLEETLAAETGDEAAQAREQDRQLRLSLLDHKRREVNRLRDNNEIDDAVQREVQAALDIEEIRLLGPSTSE
ncbi:sodium/proton antiporter, CPA1 family [Micromonospora purpureochromogenes]|uniref:Sodium/proton antiporter, CPA1 family n=1 Tax=Micromonospora purpureochromogenes TaxID=47872 RepID=A0A1C4ZN78_9ACTN|nr:Na+/H+ antiporter [Micromonospora purpureochromogenes]SCF34547.1 sodium/proton antiporter, CPA1 family [Micromonospora purpureochromogenes]